ncbi:MAG: bifunctional (p)ppGpp synthetase/guanosine-3',5'-bis(diphosphate) 3'-pyrophosphohydrolase [Chlorobi bacterium]|nr:bifunctional (p)ppGpp synthetase/guanosine-3',5'-bis(diphosphate) 3'-pyrophosphohydrolase [Chlorobiota bacterium]
MQKKITGKEQLEINEHYEKLISSCKTLFKKEELVIIKNAFSFLKENAATIYHSTGKPLILYSLECALIVFKEIGLSSISIAASLLQFIPEYTNIDIDTIRKIFGKKLVEIIEGVNRISEIHTGNLSLQAENFIKLLLSLSDDIRIILIKLADRLYSMRNIELSDKNTRQIAFFNETKLLYAPIAHRLGLYNLKTELEELAMKSLETDIYQSIAKKLKETKANREKFINEFIEPLKSELNNLGFKVDIKGRPKSIHSIWNKMKKQGVEFEEVYDLFAIRIIIETQLEKEKEDCWRVYSIVTNHYTPNPKRLRDWISSPKSSGYESLHTTVVGPEGKWVEVQIRTVRMDEIAEKGHAAHWKYKETAKNTSTDEWLKNVREILEKPDFDEEKIIDETKISLYSNDIFIFTPNGDIKKLKKNSTVLDFAFSIHSNIGSTCTGAKVNGKIVPFKYVLNNGDKVEIHTSKAQTPKQDWLNIVISQRAKAKIRRALKQKQFEKAEEGRELLQRKFIQQKFEFNDETINFLIVDFKLKSALELYQKIGDGKIEFADIKSALQSINHNNKDTELLNTETSTISGVVNQTIKSDVLVIGKNLNNIDYKFAKCCNPVFGDKVFGFITINSGTKIHRKDCPNAKEMWSKYPYRFIPAQWSEFDHDASFMTALFITGIDRTGMINNISKVITTDLQVNMRSINLNSQGGVFEGKVEILIKDKADLDSLMKNIKKIKGVLKVTRI